ncbi:HNH endonuclease [Gordonia phage DalanDe]|nr:HNH endonuclease [Gordonia phage DalanDe]
MPKTLNQKLEAGSYRDDNGCRVWARKKVQGVRGGPYGQVWWDGKYQYVHRIVWAHERGSIPKGWHVHHKCENTLCSEPSHLQAVSPKRHWELTNSKNRRVVENQQCVNGHRMTVENTYVGPNGRTKCRACNRERLRKKRGYKTEKGPYKVSDEQRKLAQNASAKNQRRRARIAAQKTGATTNGTSARTA